ncbi:MAG TPA: ABC transporter ATP-binding protein, partial [Pyrinomonadaceae bacterium]
MKPIIKVEGLGKRYRIGAQQSPYGSLRETLAGAVRAPLRRLQRRRNPEGEESTFWAVKDVSFEVQPGEVVGIIGRNGAGKSTLLKMLSRITEPTTGRIELYGRVGSLLEVGTGFHPELSGRENIYLNGAILGMAHTEIARKFDEIVAFAEVERFIDTPVKHYSSGMYLRLAFAVAAHLEPEILIVDEVLAVGDMRFQRKCLDKMQDVGKRGRTVIFVSHNMPAITRLCPRTILLDGGTVLRDGPSYQVVSAYLSTGLGTTAARSWPDLATAPGNDVTRLRAVCVRTAAGQVTDALDIRQPVEIEVEYEVLTPGHVLVPNLHFYNEEGVYAFIVNDLEPAWRNRPRDAGRYRSVALIPGNLLSEGTLFVGVAVST